MPFLCTTVAAARLSFSTKLAPDAVASTSQDASSPRPFDRFDVKRARSEVLGEYENVPTIMPARFSVPSTRTSAEAALPAKPDPMLNALSTDPYSVAWRRGFAPDVTFSDTGAFSFTPSSCALCTAAHTYCEFAVTERPLPSTEAFLARKPMAMPDAAFTLTWQFRTVTALREAL